MKVHVKTIGHPYSYVATTRAIMITTATLNPRSLRFGMITPSSNTALEPLTQQIVSQIPGVSVHLSRFRVLKIALDNAGLAQFDNSAILQAAELLADAKVDVIGWSGTSSGWLGFEADEKLCNEITVATGIPATTSVLGLNRLISHMGINEMGLLTPYTNDVQEAITRNYRSIGVDCTVEKHLGKSDNKSFGYISEKTLDEGFWELVGTEHRISAVTVFCTGLKAAQLVDGWEQKSGVIVLDTVATVLWDMCRIAGVDTNGIEGWGKLFKQG